MPSNIYIRTHTAVVPQDGKMTAAVTESQMVNRDLCELLGIDKVGDSPFQRELAYWTNVAKMPRLYKDEPLAPKRGLGGVAFYRFMAGRLRISVAEVMLYLGNGL